MGMGGRLSNAVALNCHSIMRGAKTSGGWGPGGGEGGRERGVVVGGRVMRSI